MPSRGPPAPPRLRARSIAPALAILTTLLVSATVTAAPLRPGAYPTLPVTDGRQLLGNLSAPTLLAGSSGSVSFTVADPLTVALTSVDLTFEVYAFNAFPGNSTSTVPVSGAPVLTTPATSGSGANVSIGSVLPGTVFHGSVGVSTSSSTPSGTFAVRSLLSFDSNGSVYLLESRGWFSSSEWASATELPNGSVTLNLSRLGVSGVLPETAIYVASSGIDWALAILSAAGVVFVGVGAWVYFRRGPGSTSGTR